MEAELVVPKAATREAVYLTNLMGELGFEETFKCVPLHSDNISAPRVTGYYTFNSRVSAWLRSFLHLRNRAGGQG